MLKIEELETYYGASQALFGLNLSINEGEVVTLMGRNGMGKTTTVNSILGITPPNAGYIYFGKQQIQKLPSYKISQLGIGLVPEGRQIFPNLTVRENLVATASNRLNQSNPWNLDKILKLFTGLQQALNNSGSILSGGEQQMLAIGRALMTNPKLLILDEATEGLAPLVREIIWSTLKKLKAQGLSILIIDKNLNELSNIADQHVIIEKGRVVWSGSSQQLASNPKISARYLGI
jgi:branched-chain amino acid transport system ATP-binding protein